MSAPANAAKLIASAFRSIPTKRYVTYINSPQWAAKRREHLRLCGHWCEICKKAPAIQVHHWTYKHLGYEYPHELCAVCVWCHWKIHRSVMPTPANDNQQLVFTFDETEQANKAVSR